MLQLPPNRPSRTGSAAGPRPRRAGAALLATGLATLACAAPASAAYEMYGVEVDAVVETTYTGESHSPEFEHDSSLALSTNVRAGFLAVIDRAVGGRIIGASGEDQHVATTTGAITTREREFDDEWNDWWERGTECRGAGESKNDEGRTSLHSDPLTPLTGASLVLNLADKLLVDVNCTNTGRNGGAGPGAFTLESPWPEDEFSGQFGPLAVQFDLPAEATAAGKVIQLFEGPAGGHAAYCPTDLDERQYKKSCKVTYRGTITLEKVTMPGEQPPAPTPVVVPPAAAPPVQTGPGPVRPAQPSRPAVEVGGRVPALGSALKRGLPLRLAGLPAGKVNVTATAGGKLVATGTTKVGRAGKARVTLKFSAQGRKRLAKQRSAKLVVKAGKARATVTLKR